MTTREPYVMAQKVLDENMDEFALVDQAFVSELAGVSKRTLEDWRFRGVGPAFVRLGPRCIRYRLGDVKAYLDANTVRPKGGGS